MINFKQEIAKKIAKVLKLEEKELQSYIEIPKDAKNGDYAFPCFRLAKQLKKAPIQIASEIKEKINMDPDILENIEVLGGYLNFYINRRRFTQEVLTKVEKHEEYGRAKIGEGKTIIIDYSAPNIAKPFHIGHLRSTVIGGALYNIYKYLGYHTIGINHLGDYGTQFGKLIEGYKLWGKEYNIEEDPINELTKIYIRINQACKEKEEILENCRNNFKKLEDGDPYCTEIWEKFKSLSLKEFQKVYDLLGSQFDSWKGESFYSDKMGEVIEILEKTGKIVQSQGAKIIDLAEQGIDTPCIIEKSNGSTTYATRDLAAILYRARTYDFDKALYLTSYEQVLHFKQIFEVAKCLGIDEKYIRGLQHIPFGMVLLPTGKMSTREGNVIKLEELLKEAIQRAEKIIEEKNPDLENKKEVAKKVGIGAIVFNDLANSRIKDEIFDWNQILNFQGETGPYLQYTYVRTKSILDKAGGLPEVGKIKIEALFDEPSQNMIKLIYLFEDILIQVTDKDEPSILARYLIHLAKAFSCFYNENKIITEDIELQEARVYLTYCVGKILNIGTHLLGMEMPDKM